MGGTIVTYGQGHRDASKPSGGACGIDIDILMRMMNSLDSLIYKIGAFVRAEAVLCIALFCALVSGLFVDEGHDFLATIDVRVLALLFCLMAAVGGLRQSGLLARCAHMLARHATDMRSLCLALVSLPFFASMLVTNDVALLAFVPFAIAALIVANATRHLARVIVLQAVAANIGGMVTPMGNPQNLFLYTTFDIPTAEFFFALAPFAIATLIALAVTCLGFKGARPSDCTSLGSAPVCRRQAAGYAALFCLCLAAVMRVIPYQAAFLITLAALSAFDRTAFKNIDYGLLGTFICFFVFSGNIASIPSVSAFLESLMQGAPFLTSAGASQIVSNVPAAVLLAGFTDDWRALLLGVDLGGLGTPVASLASLIACKLYLHTPNASLATFMKEFAAANAIGLAGLTALYCAIYGVAAL